jgi:excisionase family DNA binding protein
MSESRSGQYLTPSEVAVLLHVSPKTVSRWATQGYLPCLVTLGGHRRFRREDVDDILREMGGAGPVPSAPSTDG